MIIEALEQLQKLAVGLSDGISRVIGAMYAEEVVKKTLAAAPMRRPRTLKI